MDHGGQFERDSKVMSQVPMCEVDLCDNLPNPEVLTAQTRNLNQTNTLTQTLSLSQTEAGLIRKTSLNYGKDKEEDQGNKGYTGRGREEDEDEDVDEVMKEVEEEEESEESSSLICCQSPDTPMTDSSYSETGSLSDTPYPFSPGTSPDPTYPVIPVVSSLELSHSDAEVDPHISNMESVASTPGSITLGPAFTTRPADSVTPTVTSDTRPTTPSEPTCITGATDRRAKNAHVTTEYFTSSTEPIFHHEATCTRGFASSYAEPATAAETFSLTRSFSTTTASTAGRLSFTTGPTSTGTESPSNTGPINSNWEHITSMAVPTYCSVYTRATGPILIPAPLESLEQLAQKGDDTHFPQYLHQIAETFVLQENYQWALWCIQLERLYHQRLLDNLNTLQEQWESQCRKTSSDLETQHLDTLKHICLTHSRPRARDAVHPSVDFLRPACTSAYQVDGGMERSSEDPSCSQSSHPDVFHRSQLTDKEHSDRGGGEAEGEVEYTITVIGNGQHPSIAGGMDQSKPAEQQGGDLGPAQEKEAKREEEEKGVEKAAEALEMKDEGEEEEEQKQKDRACQKAVPAESLSSGAEVEVHQLQEALAEEKLHEQTQETPVPQEAHMKQQEQAEEEEEEEEEYEVEQADIIREAASLDNMAKLITVEEMSPASGLVSILKKRSVCEDNTSLFAGSLPRPDKPTAKRRVRFRVPDDSYENDVGGGDSCLLLFLLCLVTVVISVGGTALYCALGDSQSSVCQDFSRNADFYVGELQRRIAQIQHWFTPGS